MSGDTDSQDDTDAPDGSESWRHHFHQTGGLRKDKLARVEGYLSQLEHAMRELTEQMADTEGTLRCSTPVGPEAESSVMQYSQLISSCHDNITQIKTIEKQLKKETGLSNIGGAGRQIHGILHRWQALQTQAIEKDYRLQEHKDHWKQFKTDIVSMGAWLEEAEAVQATQTHIPTNIKQLEVAVRRHRVSSLCGYTYKVLQVGVVRGIIFYMFGYVVSGVPASDREPKACGTVHEPDEQGTVSPAEP